MDTKQVKAADVKRGDVITLMAPDAADQDYDVVAAAQFVRDNKAWTTLTVHPCGFATAYRETRTFIAHRQISVAGTLG